MDHIESNDRLLLRPSRAFVMADVPRSTGYALIASGEWPSLRIGRAIRIPAEGLREWIERRLVETQEMRDERVR